MVDERGDGTHAVDMKEVEREREESVVNACIKPNEVT